MSLWERVLDAYARPGAPEACLALQDEHGQNAPLLLWAAHARRLEPALLKRAADAARAWDAVAVSPLRAVRRSLKTPCPPEDDAGREALREAVKALELQAERLLLETLETLGETLGEPAGAATPLEAMTAVAQAWGPPAPERALAALADALE